LGKNIIIVLFLILTGLSAVIFIMRDDRSLREQVQKQTKGLALVTLEGFTVYKYNRHAVTATLSGKVAQFNEPNDLELYGNISFLRNSGKKREYALCEAARVEFKAKGVTGLMKDGTIVKSELENNVRIGSMGNILLTEYAEYLDKNQLLHSDQPVRLEGNKGTFAGTRGFTYELKNETLTIAGPIEGTLQSDGIPHGK